MEEERDSPTYWLGDDQLDPSLKGDGDPFTYLGEDGHLSTYFESFYLQIYSSTYLGGYIRGDGSLYPSL